MRRNRRVGAHRADGFLPGGCHRRHQDLGVFLGVAERLLAVEQRDILAQRPWLDRLEIFQDELGALQPFPVGILGGQLAT
jgi:hypothetical protein